MITHVYCPILGSQFTFSKPVQRPILPKQDFTKNVLKMQGVIRTPLQPTTDLIVSNLKPVLRKQFQQRERNGK